MQARRWTYTLHYTEDEQATKFQEALRQHPSFRGLVCQSETCPKTSKTHIQGYAEFNKPVRQSSLKKLDRRVHWEVAKGTRAQNITYCTKEDTRTPSSDSLSALDPILQEESTQGRRTDLLDCAKNIVSGNWSKEELVHERPDLILKFSRGVNELYRIRSQADTKRVRTELRVEVIWGAAGTGKTRFAFGPNTFILENSNSDLIWWDGYEGESVLLVDDFYGWIRHNLILRLLDIYPCRLDVKGGSTYAAWNTVYITSNQHPSQWYRKFEWGTDDALRRRIHRIWHVTRNPNGTKWEDELSGTTKNFDNNYLLIN